MRAPGSQSFVRELDRKLWTTAGKKGAQASRLFPQDGKATGKMPVLPHKNTCRTRGAKGCYVYSADPETNLYLQTQGAGALLPEIEEPEIPKNPRAYPFPILSPEEAAGTNGDMGYKQFVNP